jgi:hypothetical protein
MGNQIVAKDINEVSDLMVEAMEILFQVYTEVADNRDNPQNRYDSVLLLRNLTRLSQIMPVIRQYFVNRHDSHE